MSGSEESACLTPPADDWPDTELLSAAADGDEGAWGVLVDRYVEDVWTAACTSGASPGAAAGATAVAWLQLSQRLGEPEVTEGLSVRSWLARTALGAARSAARAASTPVPDPRHAERPSSTVVLEASSAALQRAHELVTRLKYAQRQSERAISRAEQLLLTALSVDRSSPELHALPDIGPLTDQRGVTLCALLVGDEVRLLQGIQWNDVRAADRCAACAGVAAS